MNAADTFQAAIPEPYQILRLNLKPFCLGHYYTLRRFGCAFVSDDETEATLDDLILAVLVCSQTWEGFFELMEASNFKEQIKRWGEEIGLDFDIAEKVQLMNAYLEKAFRVPVVLFTGDSKPSGAHWSMSLKSSLLQMGYTQSEAMNLPLSEAFAMFYKRAEDMGILEIAPPEMATLLQEGD